MTIFLLVLAIFGWLAAFISFALVIFMSVAFAAQEAKYSEKINDLKKSHESAILMKYRRNQN